MAKSPQIQKRQDIRKAQIIEMIRRMPSPSRAVIQKASHMSMESTLGLIGELLDEGLVMETGKSDTTVGRKPVLLKINPDGCYSIGIRFNARYVMGVVIDFEHQPVITKKLLVPEHADTASLLETLRSCIGSLIAELGQRADRLIGIGIGTPGIIDFPHDVVRRYIHIPDWMDVPLRELVQASFALPVSIEHGVRCTARALHAQTRYSHAKNMVLLQMDRGVNMCVLAGGNLYSGSTGIAGEIGHVKVTENGLPCACGRSGCLETIASDVAILRRVRQRLDVGGCQKLAGLLGKEECPTCAKLLEAAELGDSDCLSVLFETGSAVGKALASVITLLNPDSMIIGGDLVLHPAFQQGLLETIEKESLRESLEAVQITFEKRDDLLDACGAARLPLTKRFKPRDLPQP